MPGAPGNDGEPGADGADGNNAYTVTTADILLPAAAGPVVLASTVALSSWASIGQVIFISDGTNWGHFRVLTIPSALSFTLEWLDYPDDAAGTSVIASGATVSPAGVLAAFSLPAAVDYSALTTAGAVDNLAVAAGVGMSTIEIPHTFIAGTAAVEPVTNLVIPFKFKLVSWSFVTNVALVGGGGSRVANMEIGTVDVGTVVSTVTILIAATAVGTVTAGTAISGAQTGAAGATLSIEIAAGGTEFSAGSGTFVITIQNMDEADAVAALADHVNDLITALT